MQVYSDYGDITGIQTIRRFISTVDKQFGVINTSVNETIRVVNELIDVVEANDAGEIVTDIGRIEKEIESLQTKIANAEIELGKVDEIFRSMASDFAKFNTDMGNIIDVEMKKKFDELSTMNEEIKEMGVNK